MFARLRKLQSQDGFTLIELLIVVIILAILAAIIIFAVGKFRDDAVVNACKSDFKSIQTAEEAYKAKTGTYLAGGKTTWTGLVPDYMASAPPGGSPGDNYAFEAAGTATLTITVYKVTTAPNDNLSYASKGTSVDSCKDVK